jgi:hypothetical protein
MRGSGRGVGGGGRGGPDNFVLDIDQAKTVPERSLENILKADQRTFRRHLESLETQASQGRGARSATETRQILDEALKRGWKIRGGVDTHWVGGRHINLIGPSMETLHFPLPAGFDP